MTSYQILDISRALKAFGDEATTLDMINQFAEARTFKTIVEDYHQGIMTMKSTGWDTIGGCMDYVSSPEVLRLLLETRNEVEKKDRQKVIQLHLIFLRKCVILHRELEDYLKKPVASPDLRGYIGECLKELGIEDTGFKGEGKNDASCDGCSIF